MRKSLKGHDVKFEGGYVERNDGVSGGGPTYMLIYLRKKIKPSKRQFALSKDAALQDSEKCGGGSWDETRLF